MAKHGLTQDQVRTSPALVATKDVCMNGSTRYIACVVTLSGVRVGTT